ncbi:DEAD/DEAH box helicase [Streptomyces sp. 8L]|uniref:DEAD/DEAH box helicase n=1 Tax=Streptomyces sp. 8L TaxID=2877242 RepID=UPI001CD352D7|nr:DEAD/DEAH box helicase [Streptomyces sp. 8L]MCA1219044.1 DEAD/DEAH box helicase [Streptomyces sp. 8L]
MNRSPGTNNRSTNSSRGASPRRAGSAGSGSAGRRNAPRRSGAGGGRGGGQNRAVAQPRAFTAPEPITPALPSIASFDDTDMPAALLAALRTEGVTVPFPVQAATLPNSLAGRDVLGRGRTGSGKTLAFGLSMIARTAGRRALPRRPLALVLVPTRELAQQVADALSPYARAMRLRTATVVGGLSIGRQADALRSGAEIVVATPGRLRDLVERGDCVLSDVTISVLDEADQMADMGFMPQVTALVDQVSPDAQHMLFSATLDANIDRLVRRYLSDPVVHIGDPSDGVVSTMEHHVLHVRDLDKQAVTIEIAAREGRVLMFLDTKHAADRLAKNLLKQGVRAAALHGGKSQSQRTRTLTQFKDGLVNVLVATNVAARGIHVDQLDLVVNVDPPADHKDYLHRGGRTARAGESGLVVTLVLPEQRREVGRLINAAGITAVTTQVNSGEAELSRITGARKPSGVPVVITPPPAPARTAGSGTASRSRRSRPAAGRRRNAAGSGTARETHAVPAPRSRRGGGHRGEDRSGTDVPRTDGSRSGEHRRRRTERG